MSKEPNKSILPLNEKSENIYDKYYRLVDVMAEKSSIQEFYGFVVFLTKLTAYSMDKLTEKIIKEGVKKK